MTLRPRPPPRANRIANRSGRIDDDDDVGDLHGASPSISPDGGTSGGGGSSGEGSRERSLSGRAALDAVAHTTLGRGGTVATEPGRAIEFGRLVKQQPRSLAADLAAFTRLKIEAAAMGHSALKPGAITPALDVRRISGQSRRLDLRVMLASFVENWLLQTMSQRYDRIVHVGKPDASADDPIHG